MKKKIFLSHFLSETTPGYGGQQGFFKKQVTKISEGASSNSQEWRLSNHIGTHIDLPFHFDEQGKNLNCFAADEWIFEHPFLVELACKENEIILPGSHFESVPLDCDILIIKTGFQKYRNENIYWSNNPGLSPELASWLRENRPNLKIIGFDFISITSYSNRPLGRIAHRAFLSSTNNGEPLRVIEDMKLDELTQSPKLIVVAPFLVDHADGTPVTVISIG